MEAIHENLLYLKNRYISFLLKYKLLHEVIAFTYENCLVMSCREAEMRIVNEATNSRVALYSMLSLAVCVGVSVLQIMHLKRFFQKKKLI